MFSSLSSLTTNLLVIACFAGVVVAALRIAQSIFGTNSKRAAATEVAAKLVSFPTGSSAVIRRRFVRALTSQHVVMPSGERLAFSNLEVRIAPEDVVRLDPEEDLDRLGEDAAKLYVEHAERSGWAVPPVVHVTVHVDAGLRSGWVPPARGTGAQASGAQAAAADRPLAPKAAPVPPQPAPAASTDVGWEAVPWQSTAAQTPDPDATQDMRAVAAPLRVVHDAPTVTVAPALQLSLAGRSYEITEAAVLGRGPGSPVPFSQPEVSGRHLQVRRAGAVWEAKDVGSTNGSTLNGAALTDWMPLRPGDVLRVADVEVTVGPGHAPGTVALRSVSTR
jgi:hypothetical protein